MRIIKPSVEFMHPVHGEPILKLLESCGRVCYKSEGRIEEGSAEQFIAGIVKRGHESVLEHAKVTVKFTCDRGVTHEIVRHRIASYSQESTRYCNYAKDDFGNEITVIEPLFFDPSSPVYRIWKRACETAEIAYCDLLGEGRTPQEARAVLPNSLKTELVMTANLREWRHFFRLRCATAAHPQCREVALMALEMFHEAIPIVFDDLWEEFCNG